MRFLLALGAVVGFCLLTAAPGIANAQATRTWVSGVGDDANPCSRTAPCKTFAGAISKTATAGEIDCLDPGGFGAVTITKSITIDCKGYAGGVLSASIHAISVNDSSSGSPGTAVVVLNGVDVQSVGIGANGISFISGARLTIRGSRIANGTGVGINIVNTSSGKVDIIDTVVVDNAAGGILARPAGSATLLMSLQNVQSLHNQYGLRVEDRATVSVSASSLSSNNNAGVVSTAASTPSNVTINASQIANNGTFGLLTSGAGNPQLRVANSTIAGNATGMSATSGNLYSSSPATNGVANDTDGAFNGTFTLN